MPKHPHPIIWTNRPLVLYHGTVYHHAESVLSKVDLKQSRRGTDFGRGFYTTTWLSQATEWAEDLSFEYGDSPAVVEFTVDRVSLAALSVLGFVRGEFDAENYWSLIWNCRKGRNHQSLQSSNGWYDVVMGPVSQVCMSVD